MHKPHAPIAAIFEDVGVVLTRATAIRAWLASLIALGGNVGDVRATFEQGDRRTSAAWRRRRCWRARPIMRRRPGAKKTSRPSSTPASRSRRSLDPHALLFVLHKVEQKFGRDRARERRWGPRTLDLDLIAYDDVAIDKPELTLPHPRLFERAFVLVPLAEIAPDRVIRGRRVDEALADLSTDGIERLPDASNQPKATRRKNNRLAWPPRRGNFRPTKSELARRETLGRMTSATDDLRLAADFPQATEDDWRKLVDGVLKGAPFEKLVGKTYDGLKIAPIYPRAKDAGLIAGRAPAAPWQIMQRVDHPDAAKANAQAPARSRKRRDRARDRIPGRPRRARFRRRRRDSPRR